MREQEVSKDKQKILKSFNPQERTFQTLKATARLTSNPDHVIKNAILRLSVKLLVQKRRGKPDNRRCLIESEIGKLYRYLGDRTF